MTLSKFERLLKKINPKLRLRVRGEGDVIGLYYGRIGYICRLSKGELHMNGYRWALPDPENPMKKIPGRIKKRGRKTVVNLLRNYRWVTNHKQRSMLTWGIEYSDEEVGGAGRNQYGT